MHPSLYASRYCVNNWDTSHILEKSRKGSLDLILLTYKKSDQFKNIGYSNFDFPRCQDSR